MSTVAGRRLRGKTLDFYDKRFWAGGIERPKRPKRNRKTGLLEFSKPKGFKKPKKFKKLRKLSA